MKTFTDERDPAAFIERGAQRASYRGCVVLVVGSVFAHAFLLFVSRVSMMDSSTYAAEGVLRMSSNGLGVACVPTEESAVSAAGEDIAGVQGRTWKAVKIKNYKGNRWRDVLAAPMVPPPADEMSCDRWVVVTTIGNPTELADQVALLEGFCSVFVGDLKSPPAHNWYDRFPNAKLIFLDVEAQKKLTYETTKLLPYNHFGRKNLGYLYALHHGAKIIYDTDDDNFLIPSEFEAWLKDVTSSEKKFDVWRTKGYTVNPYKSFGVKAPASNLTNSAVDETQTVFVWPRGMPARLIRDRSTWVEDENIPLRRVSSEKIGVVQFLANRDPDVDGMYRLTGRLPLRFSDEHRGAVMPPNVLVPFNGQATLFLNSMLWGLLLPCSVHGRVSDIWRSYLTQRLMWDLQGGETRVMFTNPAVRQVRNAHDYLADFNSELPLYQESDALVAYLLAWRPRSKNLADRLEELYIDMYELGVLGPSDVVLVQSWIRDLVAMGQVFPDL